MEKKKIVLMTIVIFVVGLIIAGASYAFWSWNSTINKNVIFNTANNLKNYIVYNEGESAFTGELNVSNNYQTGGIHSTISIYKTTNVNLLATIHMDINQIGENMKNSPALKWVVTEGTTSNVGAVLAKGNFIGTKSGDVLTLVPDINVTTTETFYTIWIWLDSSANPSDNLSGETLDTNVWTEINQVEGAEDRYEVTNTTANYQAISATVVDSKYKVTHYAVTTTNSEPTTWTTITPETDQAKVYNLNTTVNNTGTYYIWFKDESGRVTSKSVTIDAVDNSAPVCTWGTFNPTQIQNNQTAQIDLTCIDEESEITIHNLTTNDITPSNNKVTVTDITKESVTNGFKYTITIKGTENNGTATLTLVENSVKNAPGYGNESKTTQTSITVANAYTVKYQSGNSNCTLNSTTYANKSVTYGSTYSIANPTCAGYIFDGWTADSGLDTVKAKYGSTSANYSWTNASTKVKGTSTTYFKDLALTSTKMVTLTANWVAANYLNTSTNTYYIKLSDAFANVASGQTIKALNDVTESANVTLANTKTGVKFDLNGKTISMGNYYIKNNGELDIYNSSSTAATLQGSTYQVISNSGTLTTNATSSTNTLTIQNTSNYYNYRVISNSAGKNVTLNANTFLTFTNSPNYDNGIRERSLINTSGLVTIAGATLTNNVRTSSTVIEGNVGIKISNESGRVVMTSGTIETYGDAIWNASGTGTDTPAVAISGGTITSTNSRGIYNNSTGTVLVTDGTINGIDGISNNSTGTVLVTGGTINGGSYGIGNYSTGTITLGTNDGGTPSTTSPVINSTSTSGNYGVCITNASGTFNFYDGKITSSAGTGHALNSAADDIVNTPDKYVVSKKYIDGVYAAILEAAYYQNTTTNRSYLTLKDAFSAVASGETIKVLKNATETSVATLEDTKTGVKLDLNGKTITMETNYINNNGELDIYNSSSTEAILQGSNSDTGAYSGLNCKGVICNNGTLTTNATSAANNLTIRNTTTYFSGMIIYNKVDKNVTLNANTFLTFTTVPTATNANGVARRLITTEGTITIAGATLNNTIAKSEETGCGIQILGASGRVIMTSGSIETYGKSVLISSDATDTPAVAISGGTITSTNSNGILNNSTGTVLVTDGTINGGVDGIRNNSTGTITIGTNGVPPSTTSPVINSTSTSGSYYGVYISDASGTFNFYDGKITSSAGTGHALNSIADSIVNTPNGYGVSKSTTDGVETATLGNFYTAYFYYQSNNTNGSTTITSVSVKCTPSYSGGPCAVTIPTVVKNSVGTYNNAYAGLSTSTGNMTEAVSASATTVTLSAVATYYSLYRSNVTIYRPSDTSSCTSSQYYRNQWFTSYNAMATTVLSTSTTGTSNSSTPAVVSGYTFSKLTTANSDGGTQYTSIANAVQSDTTTFYMSETKSVSVSFRRCDGTNCLVTGTVSGSGTQTLYCTDTSTAGLNNGTVNVPDAVTTSTGPNGSSYFGLSTVQNSTTITTTINTGTTQYYAVYGGDYTATFTKDNSTVSSIGSTSLSCSSRYTYNGSNYAGTDCVITLPSITPNTGYAVSGWYDSNDNLAGQPNGSRFLTDNATFTAKGKQLVAREFLYSNNKTGVECHDVQCMIDYLDKGDQSNTNLKLGDYISYTPSKTSYTTDTSMTGYISTETINPSELNLWRVISLNADGTVDIISEHVSSTTVSFMGQIGYQNLVGYLNVLAKQYETTGVTVGSRHFGYNGQTEYITDTTYFVNPAPWTCSTNGASGNCSQDPDDYEAYGGGDTLYQLDYDLINTVLGTRVATNPSGTATSYWMATRYYNYSSSTVYYWRCRSVKTSGSSTHNYLYDYYSSSFNSAGNSNALRPIVTLKSGLSYSGVGTESSPKTIG